MAVKSGRLPVYILSLLSLVIIGLFIAAMFLLDRQAVVKHEGMFNEQQALQVLLAKHALEDHVREFWNEARSFARYDIDEYLEGVRDAASLGKLFALSRELYPTSLSYLFLDAPTHVVCESFTPTPAGETAHELSVKWAGAYWYTLSTLRFDKIVPPLFISTEFQMMGSLFPIVFEGEFRGLLVAVLDFTPVVERYVATMRSGLFGAGYLLDGQGTVVYDHGREVVGRNIFDGLHANYTDLMRVDRKIMSETEGMDEYVFTLQRRGEVSRKLIAWNSLPLGTQKLVICLSAPDVEIDQTLSDSRVQSILSGVLLALALVLMNSIMFTFRQRMLKENAQELQRQVERRTKELAISESRYRSLYDAANDAIFLMSDDRIIDCNSKTSTFFGDQRSHIIGKSLYDFSPGVQADGCKSDQKGEEKLRKALEGTAQFFEWQLQRLDRSLFYTEVSLNRLELNGESYLLAIVRDITQRKKAEEGLQRLNDELELRVRDRTHDLRQANQALQESLDTLTRTQQQLVQAEKIGALGRLVAGVAHEINTPVGVGVTAASFLHMRTREILTLFTENRLKRSDVESFFHTATQSSELLLSTLQRTANLIRVFKQIAVNGSHEKQQRFYVKECLETALSSIQSKMAAQHVQVSVDCQENLTIYSYPGVFSQILVHLAMNSLLHGFEIQENGKISLKAMQEEEQFVFRYHDTGQGMKEEHLAEIFEPFFTTKRSESNTGLGLHLVHNLVVQLLGGTISCRSRPEQGVTFEIVIPNECLQEEMRRGESTVNTVS